MPLTFAVREELGAPGAVSLAIPVTTRDVLPQISYFFMLFLHVSRWPREEGEYCFKEKGCVCNKIHLESIFKY